MSLAKVTIVQKAIKDQGACDRCGDALPKGAPYRWFVVGFRSKHKQRRCLKDECTPSRSTRESSKLAEVYGAIDDALDTIAKADDPEDITSAVEQVYETMTETANEYTEASTDDQGNVFNTVAEERGQELESNADALSGWQHTQDDEPPACSEHEENTEGCEDCQEERESWIQAIRDEATEALNDADTL